MIRKLILAAFLATAFSLPAIAATPGISASHGDGAVIVGPDANTCTSGIQGAIRYTSTTGAMEFCNGTGWATMVAACGARPDDFSFSNITGATASTVTSSSIQQMTNITCASSPVSISGGSSSQFQICSDSGCSSVITSWRSTASTIQNNQYLQIRQTSSASSLGVVTATITVGGQARNWSVTTQDLGTFKYAFLVPIWAAPGGISGADTLCANAASAAGRGGTYMAWLATGTSDDPATRFTHAIVPYRRVDGTLIANNWTDLTDGNLNAGVDLDASGGGVASGWPVSNVGTNGVAKYNGTNNCSGWTSNGSGVNGHNGYGGSTDYAWTDNGINPCNGYRTLMCFQQ